MRSVAIAGVLGLGSAVSLRRDNVTPVEKVIDLLTNLRKDTEEQGQLEAKQYDEYACFCKSHADKKQYAIEKSDKLIAKLESKIEKLDGEINLLDGQIAKLGEEIADLDADIDDRTKTRADEHAKYKEVDADLSGAIAAMQDAIAALKESRESTTGKKTGGFVQAEQKAISILEKLGQKPAGYQYRSNDIIELLEELLDKFLANKKDKDTEEFKVRAAFEKMDLNLKNQRKFKQKEKDESQAVADDKNKQKAQATKDKNDEEKMRGMDADFLAELTHECEVKAQVWDQRRKTRADEITAMTGALEALHERVKPSTKANKKLAQVQLSFVQTSRRTSQSAAVHAASAKLSVAAKTLHSSVLASLVARVDSQADHFVKVRGLIDDLIAKLEEDAENEATEKGYCDDNIAKNVESRDDSMIEIGMEEAQKSRNEQEFDAKVKKIIDCSKKIAENQATLKEITDIRNNEKAEYERTKATAEEGKAGVEEALQLLQDFYGENAPALLQAGYVPPNAGRDGENVGDKAPETFANEDYHGQQTASKGIVGILEVILSDFERTLKAEKDQEMFAQMDYEDEKAEIEAEVEELEGEKSAAEDRKSELSDDITEGKASLKELNEQKKLASEALASLKKRCIDGASSYEDRVAAREKEIEALKDALQALTDWDK